MKLIKQLFKRIFPYLLRLVLKSRRFTKYVVRHAREYVYDKMVEKYPTHYTWSIRYDRYIIVANLMEALERTLTNKNISPKVRKKLLHVFVSRLMLKTSGTGKTLFIKEFGWEPPGFVMISPVKTGNLQRTEYNAGSPPRPVETLDYETVDRIIDEKTMMWDSYFTVISGDEPFMWTSDGKDILDVCRRHQDNYFLIYTDGTRITKEVAQKMAKLGNITPALSVGRFERETENVRGTEGSGNTLETMANLREAGVPFGISVTATKNNYDRILSDEFVDFFFEKQGAVHGWILQYMPIGGHQDLELLVTPEQRRWMFDREKHLVQDRHLFLIDSGNSGISTEGCMAGGRPCGFIYINGDGNVSPCPFYPYSKDNIRDIYARGGDLNDTLNSDLMAGIRKWQREYGFRKRGDEVSNMMAPCPVRDHYEFAYGLLQETGARPINKEASEALKDPLYHEGMGEYGREYRALTRGIWQRDYIGKTNLKPRPKLRLVEH